MTMPLILAIEADRRQSGLLATIGRQLGAELVISATAEAGLAAIDGRVPDLILTSALLSPADETVIANRLRELDERAAHVQTLTVPVLARPSRRQAPASGLLGKLRGSAASNAAPAGCDPALFAAQTSEYLTRAAAERRAAALECDEEPTAAQPEAVGKRAPEPARALLETDEPIEALDPVNDRIAAATGQPETETARGNEDEEIELAHSLDDDDDDDGASQEIVELNAGTLDVELDAALKEFEAAMAEPTRSPSDTSPISGARRIDWIDDLGDSRAIAETDADAGIWAALAARAVAWPTLDGPDAGTPAAAAFEDAPEENAARTLADDQPALQSVPAAVEEAPPVPSSRRGEVRAERKHPPRRARPAQDEWGLFDPDQCGFTALLEKLDALATSADDAA